MVNLTTHYMGFGLRNPLVASSSPLCEHVDNIRQMEDAGISAVVLHSLFEEQINAESRLLNHGLSYGSESYAEATNYFPDMQRYNLGPEGYLNHIRKAKEAVNIPIIASLNAASTGNWVNYARLIQQAGADALELNIYFIPTDLEKPGIEIEQMYLDILWDVKANVTIPVAVKLNPYFSAMANMANRFDSAGANALVLFNRFYMPDFDLENLEIVPALTLSSSTELLLRLHWTAILFGNIQADLAVTGGIHTAKDVVKCIMAGANVTMMTSALLRFGISHAMHVLTDLYSWLQEHEYESVIQMRGSMSRKSAKDAKVFERANYMKVLSSYTPRMR
ncbi:MAG TPA: dihydroorotate dehydrogenase-like protein [Acidobacteriota bacterium]|nr:dihydroorotate dehydrogenase-like protein [Acidobacteriota bacterium]